MKADPIGATAAPSTVLSDLLAEQVRARPDEVAVRCADGRLTYRELGLAAARLGRELRRLGARADTPVGLYAEPSLDLMTGVWGILASGGAYLPLSPDYPEDRLRYMIEDSAMGIIVTQRHLVSQVRQLAPAGTTVVALGGEAPRAAAAGPERRSTPAAGPERRSTPAAGPERRSTPAAGRPGDLAYVIYTSGSTGRPKGVLIEQHSIVSQLGWLLDQGHLGPGTTVLQKTPMSFDAAQWEILAPAAGGQVVMGAPGCYRDPEDLIDTITAHGVTTLQCVPTLLQALLDTERLASCTSLRRVFSGGEALTVKLARAVTAQLPDTALVNLYGPTECTINATAHTVGPAELAAADASAIVSIGVPVAHTRCFILDADLRPVPGAREKGELYIGGVQLARGYLNLPEQTAERFLTAPFLPGERLYRTGDLASWNEDGTIRFRGRADTQVKLRGYRVELEEITSAIEEHTWVRRAAAVVTDDPRTGFQQLIALVELNPREASLMDQGAHGAHHQSKASKLQVKAQLSNPGLRPAADLADRAVTVLTGREATGRQRREAFARKTYRFYEGGKVTRDDLRELLTAAPGAADTGAADTGVTTPRTARSAGDLSSGELGALLRWFGPFGSSERLLPKYAYASPGALYAVQMYLETGGGIAGLAAGIHYFHPLDHTLVRVGDSPDTGRAPGPGTLRVHFLGRRAAIEPVYSTNIEEVLEFETGHMLGVFEEVLPEYGLTLRPAPHGGAAVKSALGVADEDHFVGSFELVPDDRPPEPDPVDLFVQAHPGRVLDLPGGLYRLERGQFTPVAAEMVEKRHVIAINQGVYEAASFGVSAVSRTGDERLAYVSLGRTLHRLQRNALRLGLMSSGYSSRSGHPLPTAQRIDAVLADAGIPSGPSYFFLGGKVSEEQVSSTGMREDSVHMRGPTEMIRDDLTRLLPDYMIPNRVLVLDALPLTANGKIDYAALAGREELTAPARSSGAPVPPRTRTERLLAGAWGKALKYRDVAGVSMTDSFFASGGNSLIAMTLTRWINREFGISLPMQTLFGHPRLADLADRIADADPEPASRLVLLHDSGPAEDRYAREPGSPVFCWPGLGGYPMNLRLLAREAHAPGPFYGVQAAGINAGEAPYRTIGEMAAADVAEIRRLRPDGPYTLWGYSFGARVAFESAWQLEQSGQRVTDLLLICPGNPKLRDAHGRPYGRESSYANPGYVTILYSVFAGAIGAGPDLAACLAAARDEESFVEFVCGRFPELDPGTVRRITRIVGETYEFDYTFHEMAERCLRAPVTIIRAAGDDYSFIEGRSGYSAAPPVVIDLPADHYQVLRSEGIDALAAAVRTRIPSDA
ncbi:amino acid adenylation domain-containing protein [Streptomyces sp. NPDC002138]|uniref:non-ribosomal peptide synthetase family protein n=1 Tax=Streptomyces sp. NPDC002138 TaxID=3154410 RepID=UPI003327081D